MNLADNADVTEEVVVDADDNAEVDSETLLEDAESEGEDSTDEVVISIGEAAPTSGEEEETPKWVKELRKQKREDAKRIRELEDEVRAAKAPVKPVAKPKPTLADCDFDEDRFAADLLTWKDQQSEVEAENRKAREAEESRVKAWQAELTTFEKQAASLQVRDFDDARHEVKQILNEMQQSIIIDGAENKAMLVYALGKNPAEAKKLASITNPVKFAFAVSKLESQLKVTPRKAAPAPERQVRGNASPTAVLDTQLARLEAEADKSGDRSKVIAYRASKKAA